MYAVTGHTSGIGKRLYESLSPNCIGFSRSTGFDITKHADRARIIDLCSNVDVFINNATSDMGQTLLLIELFSAWQDKPKKIINVGSRIAEIKSAVTANLSYQAEKIILKEMAIRLQGLAKCEIVYKWFGYVGTEKILKKYPHFKYPGDYITEQQACQMILNYRSD
tara:strand:+ start:237 stop:734 length:498 start_codon:yes stop_codon:yes gene_type:complete